MRAAAHHDALLLDGRCGECAEEAPPIAILRGADCPRCRSPLRPQVRPLADSLELRRWPLRTIGYGLVAAASFFSGLVPLLQALVLAAGLLTLHGLLLRRALGWLSPARRLAARLTLKLLASGLTALAFVINVAVAPFVGISAFALAAIGLLFTALYIELGLRLLRRRIAAEAAGAPLAFGEWALPAALIGGALLLSLALGGAITGALYLLTEAALPTAPEIAHWLLGN